MPEVKITLGDYERFIHQYFNVRAYTSQRLGQAFCNAFGLTCPNIFYEMDNREVTDWMQSCIIYNDDEPTYKMTKEPHTPFIPYQDKT
jgi:hypothetical protein